MPLPTFPRTEPRMLPGVVMGERGIALGADRNGINEAAWYAIALERALDDADVLLAPELPAEAHPYIEVFERYVRHRAEEYMADWAEGRAIEPERRDGT